MLMLFLSNAETRSIEFGKGERKSRGYNLIFFFFLFLLLGSMPIIMNLLVLFKTITLLTFSNFHSKIVDAIPTHAFDRYHKYLPIKLSLNFGKIEIDSSQLSTSNFEIH